MSEPTRPCLICTAPSQYAHYGVDSCRNCADFYKRTVRAERSFICRRGDGKCVINPKDRHNCRGCRFERCTRLGMKWPPDNLPLRRATSQELPAPAIVAGRPNNIRERSKSLESPADQRPTMQLPAVQSRLSVARRTASELALRETALKRHVQADIPGENLLLCTWSFTVECLKMNVDDYLLYARASFPLFASLSREDQNLMLNGFATRLYACEKYSNTDKMFGSQYGRFCMATLTTVFDATNYRFFFEDDVPASSNDITSMTDHYTHETRSLIGPIQARARFTHTEYAVLFALCMWHIDPGQCLDDRLVDLSHTMRQCLFEALKAYYRDELTLDDCSESTSRLNEEMQAYALTGMLDADVRFFQDVMTISP